MFPCTQVNAQLNPQNPDAKHLEQVDVILSGDQSLYDDAFNQLNKQLSQNFSINRYLLEDWENKLAGTSLLSIPPSITIALGTSATRLLLKNPPKGGLLSLMVPSTTMEKILLEQPEAKERIRLKKMSAVYIDQPASRQINLIRLLTPNTKKLGTLADKSSQPLITKLATAANTCDMSFEHQQITEKDNPLLILRKLYQEIDVFLAVPDRFIFNRSIAKWMLHLSIRNKKPLIGFSEDFVNAGAMASLYSTSADITRQGAEWVYFYEKNGTFPKPASFPDYFSVSINQDVINTFGLKIMPVADIEKELKQLGETASCSK